MTRFPGLSPLASKGLAVDAKRASIAPALGFCEEAKDDDPEELVPEVELEPVAEPEDELVPEDEPVAEPEDEPEEVVVPVDDVVLPVELEEGAFVLSDSTET